MHAPKIHVDTIVISATEPAARMCRECGGVSNEIAFMF